MSNPTVMERARKKTSKARFIYLFFIFWIASAPKPPVTTPTTNGRKIIPKIAATETDAPPIVTLTTEITVKNTITPITSSIAAKGMSVLVTGPSV